MKGEYHDRYDSLYNLKGKPLLLPFPIRTLNCDTASLCDVTRSVRMGANINKGSLTQ